MQSAWTKAENVWEKLPACRQLKGTGENGRIMKADIQAAAKSQGSTSTGTSSLSFATPSMPTLPKDGVKRVKISKLRQAIVKAMNTANLVIPSTTLMDEIDVTKLVEFRKSQKAKLEQKLSDEILKIFFTQIDFRDLLSL